MEKLKVNYGYFWKNFDNQDNLFISRLKKKYELTLSDEPDFYFFTHPYDGKHDYLKFNCHRIFLGCENLRANWNICDYVLDSDFYDDNPRHKRFPIWAAYEIEKLTQPKNILAFTKKKKFCCMVVSNPNAKERIDFFHKLSTYKRVDSAGRYLNNIGHSVDNKLEYIKDYKFVISFENSSYPGYTTEKLIEPMLVNSIPIYWGDPTVGSHFNTKSFININDFKSYDEAIEYIVMLDNNDEAYSEMAMRPWFNNNKIVSEFTDESFIEFFDFIVEDSKKRKPVGKSIYKSYTHRFSILKTNIKFALSSYLKHRKAV